MKMSVAIGLQAFSKRKASSFTWPRTKHILEEDRALSVFPQLSVIDDAVEESEDDSH